MDFIKDAIKSVCAGWLVGVLVGAVIAFAVYNPTLFEEILKALLLTGLGPGQRADRLLWACPAHVGRAFQVKTTYRQQERVLRKGHPLLFRSSNDSGSVHREWAFVSAPSLQGPSQRLDSQSLAAKRHLHVFAWAVAFECPFLSIKLVCRSENYVSASFEQMGVELTPHLTYVGGLLY